MSENNKNNVLGNLALAVVGVATFCGLKRYKKEKKLAMEDITWNAVNYKYGKEIDDDTSNKNVREAMKYLRLNSDRKFIHFRMEDFTSEDYERWAIDMYLGDTRPDRTLFIGIHPSLPTQQWLVLID